jgi:hypothetical protein
MPYLTIEETQGKTIIPGYIVLKDGRPMAYTTTVMDARMVKLACEDWYLRNRDKNERN